MTDVHLTHINEVYCRVDTTDDIFAEISEAFSFLSENHKWDKRFRRGKWDGRIRLLNNNTKMIYKGLAHRIKKFCDASGYSLSFDDEFLFDNVSVAELRTFIDEIGLPSWIKDRDFQFDSILKCIRSKRRLLLSPTSSGKSLMIYLITMWYNKKTLIIVPTIGLVTQMASDFQSYGYKGTFNLSTTGLNKGRVKDKVTITTWQSLEMAADSVGEEWYNRFSVVFGDEAHGAKSSSMINILTSMKDTTYRFGTTGTLDGLDINKATIEGLFGASYRAISTRELIDRGDATDIVVKCAKLRYSAADVEDYWIPVYEDGIPRSKSYPEEINHLIAHEKRLNFIVNLCASLPGNKIIMFRQREMGQAIRDALAKKITSPIFYIDGTTLGEVREEIRNKIETLSESVTVASIGTTATGTNIKKLHHMIIASPMKGQVKLIQAIGRLIRLHESKNLVTMWDIIDDFSCERGINHARRHFDEREKAYKAEKHRYKIYNIRL